MWVVSFEARAAFDPILLHGPLDSSSPSVLQEKVYGDKDGQQRHNTGDGSNDPYHSLPSGLSAQEMRLLLGTDLDNPAC